MDWATQLAVASGRTRMRVYQIARQLGRVPTLDEILNQRKCGRPKNNWAEELAVAGNTSTQRVYSMRKKLGRVPTLDELKDKKIGRPRKYN